MAIYLKLPVLQFTRFDQVELYIKTFSTVLSGQRNGVLNFTTVRYSLRKCTMLKVTIYGSRIIE